MTMLVTANIHSHTSSLWLVTPMTETMSAEGLAGYRTIQFRADVLVAGMIALRHPLASPGTQAQFTR